MKAKRQAVKARTATQAKKAIDSRNATIVELYAQIRQLKAELADANAFGGIFVRMLERYMTREEIRTEAQKMMDQTMALNSKEEDAAEIDPGTAADAEPAETADEADSDGGDQ